MIETILFLRKFTKHHFIVYQSIYIYIMSIILKTKIMKFVYKSMWLNSIILIRTFCIRTISNADWHPKLGTIETNG